MRLKLWTDNDSMILRAILGFRRLAFRRHTNRCWSCVQARHYFGRPNVMRKRLTAAACVPHRRSPFIWISDALLADTFTRFCHRKRHGSNVPGPLEAQRRAARRKNTSLAYASHGVPSVDPALVFGGSKDINWWQTPTSQEPAKRKLHLKKGRLDV